MYLVVAKAMDITRYLQGTWYSTAPSFSLISASGEGLGKDQGFRSFDIGSALQWTELAGAVLDFGSYVRCELFPFPFPHAKQSIV
jgi:hypothetical protein